MCSESSGQNGGVNRNPLLPCTTKRRITNNLKSINKQKVQKIKLHGNPTTKELKKQSTRTTTSKNTSGGSGPQGWGWLNKETETQSSRWTRGTVVGETPSFIQEFIGKWARAEQVSFIVPSLGLSLQCSKGGCLFEYLR